MRKFVVLSIAALFVVHCGRGRAADGGSSRLNAEVFITSIMLAAAGDVDIAVMATRRGDLPETRELGALMHRSSIGMRDDLSRLARRRNVALPKGIEEKKVALKDNLSILQGQLFDRAYAFSVVQEMNAMLHSFEVPAAVNDAELRQFAARYRGPLQEEQRLANRLLNRLGGSPWPGVSP